VRVAQGDCVIHAGRVVHGVLPVREGHRHALVMMFQYVPKTINQTRAKGRSM
jgi:hypothetical protein